MRPWLRVFMCFLAAGCVTTTVQHVDEAARPVQSPDAVAMLQEQPRQPFTVIAVVGATGHTVFDSFDDLRHELAAQAAKLGGDAVILGPESTETEFILSGTAMIRSDRRHMMGKVIVYAPARRE